MLEKKGWDKERFNRTIEFLIKEGLVWIDKKGKLNEILYFFSGNLNIFKDKKLIYE